MYMFINLFRENHCDIKKTKYINYSDQVNCKAIIFYILMHILTFVYKVDSKR